MAEIDIVINRKGEVKIDIEGTQSNNCVKLIKPLVEAIGELKTEQKKPSWFEGAVTNEEINLHSSD